jgi:Flp pilus assembly protein TadG
MISIFLAIMAMFSADVGIVIFASAVNDRACRDACRAAAQADNYATSLKLAQAAVKAHKGDGYFISQPIVDTSKFVYQDYAGSPPPDTSPFVSVTTNTTVKIPAPVVFVGINYGTNGSMTFSKTYTFPIVKTQLYL